jgi:hypothetical protein
MLEQCGYLLRRPRVRVLLDPCHGVTAMSRFAVMRSVPI